MLKKMLKKVCARTQPCFTPLTMGKGSDRSPLSLIWPRWSSCIGSPCWGIFQDSRDAQEATTDLTCWQCRRLLLGRQMLHTDPCFVHGISPGVDGERKPCPLCLCWLWSHNDFRKMFFGDGWHKPVEQYPGKDFTGEGQKGDPPIVGKVKLFSLVLVQGDDDCVSKILR